MIRQIARLSAIAAALWLAACDNNPHPAALRETDDDGTKWSVRYQNLPEDPKSFDPQYSYDQMSRRVIEPVYDTLLEYHPLKTDPYEVVPCMLAEMPKHEVTADGLHSYVCRLKPGILYHDDPCFPGGKGREVIAADVHYILQRMCDPRVESPFLAPFAESVVGMAETNEAAKKAGDKLDYDTMNVAGFEAIDRYAFRLRLKKPFPQLLYWMAFQCMSPVAREAVEYYDGKEHDGKLRPDFRKFYAVGTGPYRIAEYLPRQRVRLERVKNYKTTVFPSDSHPPEKAEFLAKLAGKQLPFIDEVQMTILRENIPIFILTRQGYLDGMAVNKDSFAAILGAEKTLSPKYKERGMFLEVDREPSTFWIAMNLDDPIIGKNKKLRQALSASYDPATYSEIFMSGVAPVATQLLPPGIYGYQKDRKNPYGYNLERAKQLLAEAGYPNGRDANGKQLELTLEAISSGSEDRQRSEYDQRHFERLGIKVKVSENTFARLMDRQDNGEFQISSGSGWGADYPDPENFYMLFYSKNVPLAGKNYCRYRNPEFDKLFEQMSVMENSPERLAIINKMSDIIAEDVPVILTFNKQFYTAVQPWAERTHNNLMMEGGIKYLVIDPEKREKIRREWNRAPLWPLGILAALIAFAIFHAVRWNRRQNA